MNINEILQAIKKLPFLGQISGPVIGATIAIIGIVISNKSSDRRVLKQLQKDYEYKENERKNTLKKATYFESIESISLAFNVLNELSDIESTTKDIVAKFNESSSALEKVFIVADTQTSWAYKEFLGSFHKSYRLLSHERIVLLKLATESYKLKAAIEKYDAQGHALLKLFQDEHIKSDPDPKVIERIKSQMSFFSDQIKKTKIPYIEKQNELYKKQGSFLELLNEESTILSSLKISIYSAIRAELNIRFDENAFRKISDDFAKQDFMDLKDSLKKNEDKFLLEQNK